MVALATLLVKNACLPPCGGSGLKCYEWEQRTGMGLVSLRVEGVD